MLIHFVWVYFCQVDSGRFPSAETYYVYIYEFSKCLVAAFPENPERRSKASLSSFLILSIEVAI